MTHERSKFVVYRDIEDGYRWRLRSAAGESLAASSRGHRDKLSCYEEDKSGNGRSSRSGHPGRRRRLVAV